MKSLSDIIDTNNRDEKGYLPVPRGNYSCVQDFPERCRFANLCQFGDNAAFVKGTFGNGCSFGRWSVFIESIFGDDQSFGNSCMFSGINIFGFEAKFGTGCNVGAGSVFKTYPPVFTFGYYLHRFSDRVTNELMHRNAEALPFPEKYAKWVKSSGPDPFGKNMREPYSFQGRFTAWQDEWERMNDFELSQAICEEMHYITPYTLAHVPEMKKVLP